MKNKEGTELLRSIFDAKPPMVPVVDGAVRIQEFNTATAGLFSEAQTGNPVPHRNQF